MTGLIWVVGQSEKVESSLRLSIGKHYGLKFLPKWESFQKANELVFQGTEKKPSLLLTEVLFPEGSFLDVLKLKSCPPCPFVILSKHNSLPLIQACLDHDALDYYGQPMDANLLQAKLTHFLAKQYPRRRSPFPSGSNLHMDVYSLTASNDTGQSAVLTFKEFKILSILLDAYPQAGCRQQLFAEIWKNVKVGVKTLDVHVFNLRRKLEALGFEIQFDLKQGYLLIDKNAPRNSGAF